VILYELLTGKAPFDATTLPLLCASICTSPPTPLAEHLEDAPPGLWRVILRCLEKDRSKRYASVADLAVALAPFGGAASQRSAESAQRIAESHGIVVLSNEDAAPESVGRRWSWSSMPPRPRGRSRRNLIATTSLALLGVAIVWGAYGRDPGPVFSGGYAVFSGGYAGPKAAAGLGGMLVQARLAELAAHSVPPSAAPQPDLEPAATPVTVATVEPGSKPTTAPSSSSALRRKPAPAPRPRPGTARRKGSDADVLSER
jgi:hypothetical protein